jgi:hypothetical protein
MNRRKKKTRNNSTRNSRKTQQAEIGLLGRALRGLGGLGGAALGGLAGNPGVGSVVGTSFGAAVSKWLGAGDYEVSKNSLVARASSAIPTMHRTDQSVVIRHKEYVGPLTGSTAFTVQRECVINPGLSGTFPWLSGIAKNFQEYSVKGMVYHYVPTSGSAISSTSSALGSVMFQTTYRSTDTPPVSKIEMLNEYWSNEVVPFETCVHPIECDPKENPFSIHYVRAGDAVGEPLLYDIGRTFIATQGMQSAYVVGDVWVTYEIEFKKPIVSSNATSHGTFKAMNFTGSISTSAFFGGVEVSSEGKLPYTLSTGRTVIFPPGLTGTYMIILSLGSTLGVGHTSLLTFTTAPILTGCVSSDLPWGGSIGPSTFTDTSGVPGATAHCLVTYAGITISDPSVTATVQLPDGQWSSGTMNTALITVVQVDS